MFPFVFFVWSITFGSIVNENSRDFLEWRNLVTNDAFLEVSPNLLLHGAHTYIKQSWNSTLHSRCGSHKDSRKHENRALDWIRPCLSLTSKDPSPIWVQGTGNWDVKEIVWGVSMVCFLIVSQNFRFFPLWWNNSVKILFLFIKASKPWNWVSIAENFLVCITKKKRTKQKRS